MNARPNASLALQVRHLLLAALLPAVLGVAAPAPAHAGEVAQRVKQTGSVRVCIWPDYYGITFRNPRTQQLGGIDIDLSAELGATSA